MLHEFGNIYINNSKFTGILSWEQEYSCYSQQLQSLAKTENFNLETSL